MARTAEQREADSAEIKKLGERHDAWKDSVELLMAKSDRTSADLKADRIALDYRGRGYQASGSGNSGAHRSGPVNRPAI